jgi:transposase-like protein
MAEISYRRHRFPPVIIQHAVWVYLRFTLSYGDVEELLAERGLDISYETVRCWVLKFGPVIARRLRRCRPRPSNRWHLDEMVVRIAGERMYLWRAVDHEGEVLDSGRRGNGRAVPFRDASSVVASPVAPRHNTIFCDVPSQLGRPIRSTARLFFCEIRCRSCD